MVFLFFLFCKLCFYFHFFFRMFATCFMKTKIFFQNYILLHNFLKILSKLTLPFLTSMKRLRMNNSCIYPISIQHLSFSIHIFRFSADEPLCHLLNQQRNNGSGSDVYLQYKKKAFRQHSKDSSWRKPSIIL